MINSELLKEAIADAKAVRATSLANAKAALEEAFAPRFEAMFADKLKEEAQEEEGLQEVEAPNQVSGKGGEAKGPSTKAVSKGNPKQPKGGAGDADFKAVQAGKGPTCVPKLGKKVNETAEEEEEGTMNEAGLTSEDLDEIIKELEDEVAGEEEGKEEPADEVPAPAPETDFVGREGGEQLPSPTDGDESDDAPETDINADPGEGGEVNIDLGVEEQPPMDTGVGELPGDEEQPAVPPQVAPHSAPAEDEDENINLEELLAALNEEAEEEEEGEVSEGKLPPWLKKKDGKEDKKEDKEEDMDESVQNHGVPTSDLKGQNKISGTNVYAKGPDASKNQLKGKNHNISGAGNIGTGAVGGKPMQEQYKVALKEAYSTIEFLRGQINEVNLLNAKLLYTNKLFKEFAGVLDDTYRMKIVESFDLTKNVREVKLAYALLAESLNFGTQVTKSRNIQAARLVTPRGSVKQIAEGFASKPVSSTKPSQLITEGNEMALRFKKLAGIKEAPKTSSVKK
jgi:hypothetical protein